MSKVESGRCCSVADDGPEQAARRQAGIRLLGKLAWGKVGLGTASAVMALTMLILALTSNPERAPIVGASLSLGAAFMTLSTGILAFSTCADFKSSDSVINSRLKGMRIAHNVLSFALPAVTINALVWLGMSLGQVENPTQGLTGVTITTLVLTALHALVHFVGIGVSCRYRCAFRNRRHGNNCNRKVEQQLESTQKPLDEQERQLKLQQQGVSPPPAHDDGLTKNKSQGGFPAGYGSF